MANISVVDFILKSKLNIKKGILIHRAYNKILESNLFDEEFYLKNYPNLETSNINPLVHYLFYGYKEGKFPSLYFDGTDYLNRYPTVNNAGMNPLVHYVLYGEAEGKIYFPSPLIKFNKICATNKLFLNNYSFVDGPLVSIIVLNRNGLVHLKRLFDDFGFKTNYDNFEVIVVDNDSSDGSVEYLESLMVDFSLRVIKNDVNVSFSEGNNQAVKEANGEYVLLLNNDLDPTYGWLNEMVGTMLNNENVGAVGAKLVFPFYYDEESKAKSLTIQHTGDAFRDRIRPCCAYAYNINMYFPGIFDLFANTTKERISVTGAAILIKKSVYEQLGGLDENYVYGNEDVDFALKLHKSGYKTLYCPTALLFHYESSTRKNDQKRTERYKHNNEFLWHKWGNYISKNILLDKINQNKLFSLSHLKLIFIKKDFSVNSEEYDLISLLSKDLAEKDYEIELNSKLDDFVAGDNSDVIISFSEDYEINKIKARKNSIKLLWLESFNNNFNNFKDYDYILSTDETLINIFKDKSLNNVFLLNRDEDSNSYLNNFLSILKDNIINKYS